MLKTRQINKLKKILAISYPLPLVHHLQHNLHVCSKIFTTDSDNSGNGILIRRLINNKTGGFLQLLLLLFHCKNLVFFAYYLFYYLYHF